MKVHKSLAASFVQRAISDGYCLPNICASYVLATDSVY